MGRPAGLGAARIADEHQFRVEGERPEGDRADEPGGDGGAQTELDALRAHERVHAIDRRDPVGGIDPDDGAARVVAVETEAGVGVELGPGPRREGQRELRAGEGGGAPAGIERVVAPDVKEIAVRAQAGGDPELFRHV